MSSEFLAARIEQQLGPSASVLGERKHTPPAVPDHELLALIGRGSYGDVWLARNVVGRLRAVKVVWRANFSSDRPYEREFNGIVQFEPISRSHPGVIDVLHVGRDDRAGCFFYVMELADSMQTSPLAGFADGQKEAEFTIDPVKAYRPRTLAADLKRDGRLSVAKTVMLGVQLADAVGHLHRNGLVHRDVKPSNVIFIDGQARLADIGLVAAANEARSFVGTEGFIPPEGPGTVQADVFALGRLLYQAATGKDRCEFPELPSDLDRWPDRPALLELNEVLAKACAAEPRQRHANAAELAGDLNLILAGRSIRRAYGIERRLRRASWTTAAALALVSVAVLSTWFERHQRESANARAQQERVLRKRAETAEQVSRQLVYTELLEQARAIVHSGEMGQRVRAIDAISQAAGSSNSLALRREAVAALTLPDLRFQDQMETGLGCTLAELDPAFQRLALCRSGRSVEILSAAEGKVLNTLPATTSESAWAGRWSSNGRFLAIRRSVDAGSRIAQIEIWEAARARLALQLQDVPYGLFSLHPERSEILVASRERDAVLFDLERSNIVRNLTFDGPLTQIQFSPKGDRLAAVFRVGVDWRLSVVDAASGVTHSSVDFGYCPTAIDWHPQDNSLAVSDDRGEVHLVDLQTCRIHTLGRHNSLATTVRFSPEGDFLFSGGRERELICWDLRTQRRVLNVDLDSSSIQFCNDQRRCAVLSGGALRSYVFERPATRLRWAAGPLESLKSAAFSSDGRWLAVTGRKGIALLEWQNRTWAATTKSGESAIPFFSPDSSELFAYWNDGLGRWRIPSTTDGNGPGRLQELPVTKSGRRLYSAFVCAKDLVLTGKGGIEFMALANLSDGAGLLLYAPAGQGAASPDGHCLALRHTGDPWFAIYQPPDMITLLNPSTAGGVMNFSFSPQSDRLAVATSSNVEFYQSGPSGPWRKVGFLTLPTSQEAALIFAPDGKTLWIKQDARNGGLFDANRFQSLLPLPRGMLPLALSPDGRFLAVSVEYEELQIWDILDLRDRLEKLGIDWERALVPGI